MVLKILEDNRLLKEESDKVKNSLKAKTKQLSQMQETARNQMHHMKNHTPNQIFSDTSPRSISPRVANESEPKKTGPKLHTIKISPATEGEDDSSAGGLEKKDSNALKKSGFSSSGTVQNNPAGVLDSPKNNQSVKFKEESVKKNKKDSFSRAVESEKQSQARNSVNFSNLKSKKESKKSVFKIIAEEQQNRHNLFVMNDNSLPSLIFCDLDGMNDGSPQNEIKLLEKLLLKNTNIAVLNNLLSNKSFFVKVILQMTEAHVTHLYDTLKQLYIEIVELLRGARKIRNIFDSAPQIISSMSIEVRTADPGCYEGCRRLHLRKSGVRTSHSFRNGQDQQRALVQGREGYARFTRRVEHNQNPGHQRYCRLRGYECELAEHPRRLP